MRFKFLLDIQFISPYVLSILYIVYIGNKIRITEKRDLALQKAPE